MGDTQQTQFLFVDNNLAITAGQPFRLLPLGRLVKGGKARDITPDMLRKFRLPHFRPPVKLGSHADNSPAGGHLIGLEVRDDGLYGIPEWNDSGAAAMANGHYRYHSPEILWEGASYEDPTTGESINGPLIVGDALLHTPHLGEAAALYESVIQEGAEDMTTETVQMPASLFDRLFAPLRAPQEPTVTPDPVEPQVPSIDVDQFNALQSERDDLAARYEALERQTAAANRVQHFTTELADTTLAGDGELATLLADLSDEQSEQILQRVKAMSEQAKAGNLTEDVGANGDITGDPVAVLDAAIRGRMAKDGTDYNTAVGAISKETPELFTAVYGGR